MIKVGSDGVPVIPVKLVRGEFPDVQGTFSLKEAEELLKDLYVEIDPKDINDAVSVSLECRQDSMKSSLNVSKDDLISSVLDGTLTAGEAIDKLLNGRKLSSSQLSKLLSGLDAGLTGEKFKIPVTLHFEYSTEDQEVGTINTVVVFRCEGRLYYRNT